MSKQQKNLSLSGLKKQNAQTYKGKKRIQFDNGAKLDIDVVFQPTKIENVVKEVASVFDEVAKRKDGDQIDAGLWAVVMMASIIKNFTTIETDAVGLGGLVELMQELKNANYYDKIVESFDESEINKTISQVNKFLEVLNQQIISMTEKKKSELAGETSEEIGE